MVLMNNGEQTLPFSDTVPDPSDFSLNKSKDVEPERRLWLAVLAEAVDNINRAKTIAKADEAVSWFLSYNTEPGGYHWVCSILDISPSYYRKKAWRLYEIRKSEGRSNPRYGPRGGTRLKPLHLVPLRAGER